MQRPSTPPFQGGDRGFESRQGRQIPSRGVGLLLFAAWLLVRAPPAEPASPEPARGPAEIRDEQVLAQPRLTLPALGPETLGKGVTVYQASFLWSNSFGWVQSAPGETPRDRSFLVDGEARTLDLTVTHGFTDRLDLGLRLPLRWRGGGVLDGLIDAWHRILGLVGTRDGGRSLFLHDAFRVQGRATDGRPFSWNDDSGFGLGDVEIQARWRLRDGRRKGWSFALAGRAPLPTGTSPFDGNGPGVGIQALGSRPLGSAFDLFLGAGGTAEGQDEVRGVRYQACRGHAFLALEWRPGRRWSLVAETDAATRLVADIDRYPGLHWYVNVAAKIDTSARLRLELGFTENIADQQSTTDFALYFALALRRSP